MAVNIVSWHFLTSGKSRFAYIFHYFYGYLIYYITSHVNDDLTGIPNQKRRRCAAVRLQHLPD